MTRSMRTVRLGRVGLLLGALQLLLGSALTAQTQRSAQHVLWRVKGESNNVYILGSVHALSKDMYPLDTALEHAYDQAEKLVFEINMDSLDGPDVLEAVLAKGMLPAGKTLKTVLSKSTYKLAARKFKELGTDITLFEGMKPWVAAFTYMGLDMKNSGVDAAYGIDQYFYGKGKEAGKEIGGLETAAYQIGIFDNLPDKAQDAMLRQSVGDHGEGEDLPKIIASWSAGDIASLEKMLSKGFLDQPAMYDKMVVERNNNWVPQIEGFLKDTKNYLVVVGSLHLVGKVGVIEQLKAKGYQVERM